MMFVKVRILSGIFLFGNTVGDVSGTCRGKKISILRSVMNEMMYSVGLTVLKLL